MAARPVASPPSMALWMASLQSENALQASLYVGDLDPEVTAADLVEAFRPVGPLASVRLCRDQISRRSLGYGYVNFFSPSDACKALTSLNHTELKGKTMRIMWCQRDPIARKTGIGNLFVKNLAPSITSALLQEIFGRFGCILSCKVAEEHGKSKGFGFVQFKSENSAMAALRSLHGTMLEGKELYVSKFLKKTERKYILEEPKFTNLYVENLDDNVTQDALRDKFSECGKVNSVFIMTDAEGKSKGSGFVNFESHEDAKKALEALNGALLGSEKLVVRKAQKKSEGEEPLKHEPGTVNNHTERVRASNLYVKNIDTSIDDVKLEEMFTDFGKVTSAKVMQHDNGNSKGFGFVSFSTSEEAKKALDALNGKIVQGRVLYVAIAQSKEERQQKFYPQSHLQYFSASNSNNPSPKFHPSFYSFPPSPMDSPLSSINSSQYMMHPHFCRTEGAPYTYIPLSYQKSASTYTPVGHSQMGTYIDHFCQFPIEYPNPVSTKELNYSNCTHQKNINVAEASSNASSVAPRGLTPVSFLGNSNKNIGKLLYPLFEKFQPVQATMVARQNPWQGKLKKLPN
ncbi:uncharacterized protein LOC127795587 isoform X2 [Diospyros lotus]|uniref:uncharacterized protein LOC127795587 isoform X2 n=1 Tax=Diospyros lotus TaxID=55363 RepID=UPI002250C3BD|nr:uncharacterized protein LOC127795587 isoform X2 [Diospyros lotus]